MSADEDGRLQAEIELLEAMYPDQVTYNAKSREVKYASNDGAFLLRLPSGYLDNELPEVLSANAGKTDVRTELKQHVNTLSAGEEILDSLIANFADIAASQAAQAEAKDQTKSSSDNSRSDSQATVIVWLHHLLNTNKRKLALAPPSGVVGVTKPGYPGVLLYSGPARSVHEHVAELRQQNWQAFQVRLESEEAWSFSHTGVKEVESMGEVVSAVGEERKEVFMEAMRMK